MTVLDWDYESMSVDFSTLKNHALIATLVNSMKDIVLFITMNGVYVMRHSQDCCETVELEDIWGDLDYLQMSVVLDAEERTDDASDEQNESATWTFYEILTTKGAVTLRWYGTSNGYYSETASFYKTNLSADSAVEQVMPCQLEKWRTMFDKKED